MHAHNVEIHGTHVFVFYICILGMQYYLKHEVDNTFRLHVCSFYENHSIDLSFLHKYCI